MGVMADTAILFYRCMDVPPFEFVLPDLVAGDTQRFTPGVQQALVFGNMRGVAGAAVAVFHRGMDIFVLKHVFVVTPVAEGAYGAAF